VLTYAHMHIASKTGRHGNTMRILVGILHTIENEYDECIDSIRRQNHEAFEYFVLRGLPDREAHHTLYRTFMKRADEFDIFLKVDADMVIPSEHLFSGIARRFKECPCMDMLTVLVHDFFSDRLIKGMHAFRSTVTWKCGEEMVFTDGGVNITKEQKYTDSEELAPAAIHCKNPSGYQAFHYGLHRGVKVLEGFKRSIGWGGGASLENIELTWRHFLRNGDARLGLAALGAEMGLAGQFRAEHLSHSNPYAREVCACYEQRRPAQIKRLVRCMRLKNWGYLPTRWRLRMLRDGPVRFLQYWGYLYWRDRIREEGLAKFLRRQIARRLRRTAAKGR